MSFLLYRRTTLFYWALTLTIPVVALGQNFAPQAGQYSTVGALAGDQTNPQLSLKPSGGYIVWQDNITDGDGLGISARRLDSSLSGTLGNFRVNVQGTNDQEKPQVALLNNGGAAFVWQGGKQGFQNIYARFLSSSNTWVTGDVLANTFTNSHHIDPVIASLTDGNVIVAWSSFDQDGSLQGIYAQRFSPAGQKLGGEFPVTQATAYNQRTPAVAGLSDGRFVVVWVSEQQRFENSVDIYARFFDASGSATGNELLINTDTNVCANPSVAAAPDGGFAVAWGQKDLEVATNSWDSFVRTISSAGVGGTVHRANSQTYGDQFAPKISAVGTDYLVVWTSVGQDGSREGVYGRFTSADGAMVGNEFRVNTITVSQQIHPTVASDGVSRFLVTWTSFGGGINSFDLFAQRYASTAQPLFPPDPPFVSALSSSKLSVAWPDLAGFGVVNYELYFDGSATPVVVTSNMWVKTGLSSGSTHTFELVYVLTDGRHSPHSAPASGTTWGADDNFDGLPDDWQAMYWGSNSESWPSPYADSDGDGASNRDEFLAGTNPLDANSVLRTALTSTGQGLFLSWNTQPGLMYQVQSSTNMTAWVNVGSPRFAAGSTDSIYVGGSNSTYYRVSRLR
ncbi:MAG: hypothetical protein HY298_07505 [Verrucomicrobia bacterium]|nr:hypothetical protein [Verrucomicrobiota bacterium]